MQAVSDFLSCFVSFALGSAQQLRFGHSFCNFCLAPLPRACKITKLRLSSEKLPPEVFPSSSPMQALYQAELRPEYEIKNNTFFQQMQAVSDFLSCFVSFALGSAQQLRFGHSFCNFCLAPLPRACKITKLRLSSEKLPPEVFPSSSPMQALYQAELRPETVNTAFITKIVFSQSYFSLFCRKICFCPDGASFERFRLRAAQLFFLTFPLAKRRKICQSGKTYHKL